MQKDLNKAKENVVAMKSKLDAAENRLKSAWDKGHEGRSKIEERNVKTWTKRHKAAVKAVAKIEKKMKKAENPGFFNRLGNMTLKRAGAYLLFGGLLTSTGILAVTYVKGRDGKDEVIPAAIDAV